MQVYGGGGDLCSELNPCGDHGECRYIVVETVSLVQKGYPHRDLNPYREMQGM